MKYGKFYIDLNVVCMKEYGELVMLSVVKWNIRRILNVFFFFFNFYFFRYIYVIFFFENGVKMKEIFDWLGYSRILIMMDIYLYVIDKMRNEMVDIMENLRKNFWILLLKKIIGGKLVVNLCKYGLFFILFLNKFCYFFGLFLFIFRMVMKVFCGILMELICFICFFFFFCFFKSLCLWEIFLL